MEIPEGSQMTLMTNTVKEEIYSWTDVLIEFDAMQQDEERRFLVLEDIDGSFTQVACEGEKFMIERKDGTIRELKRAFLLDGPDSLMQEIITFGDAGFLVEADEVVGEEDAILALQAFFEGRNMPDHLGWRFIEKYAK